MIGELMALMAASAVFALLLAVWWVPLAGGALAGLGSFFGARETRRGAEAAAQAQVEAAKIQKEIAEQQLGFEREKYAEQKRLLGKAERGTDADEELLRRSLGFSPTGGFTLPEADLINASAAGRLMQENLQRNLLALSSLRVDPETLATLIANAEMGRQMELSRMASDARRQAAAQIAAFNAQRLMQLAGLGGAVQTPNVLAAMSPIAERMAQAGAIRGQAAMQTGQNLMQTAGMIGQGLMQYMAQQQYLKALQAMQNSSPSISGGGQAPSYNLPVGYLNPSNPALPYLFAPGTAVG